MVLAFLVLEEDSVFAKPTTENRQFHRPEEPKTGRRPATLPAGHRGAAPRRTSGAAGAAAVATGGAHADGAGGATTGARAQYFGTGVPWIRWEEGDLNRKELIGRR